MRIKATRASYGDFGHIARNRILDDVPADRARDLVERGLFTEVRAEAQPEIQPAVEKPARGGRQQTPQ